MVVRGRAPSLFRFHHVAKIGSLQKNWVQVCRRGKWQERDEALRDLSKEVCQALVDVHDYEIMMQAELYRERRMMEG